MVIPDAGVDVEEVTRVAEGPASKKRKYVPSKPPKGKDPVIGQVICDDKGVATDGEPVRIGRFTLQDLEITMSDILTDEDWAQMEGSDLATLLKRVVGHWVM